MYRLAKVKEGWIHPGTIQKDKTITVHHDVANINHYCIVSKEDIASHYEAKKNKLRMRSYRVLKLLEPCVQRV